MYWDHNDVPGAPDDFEPFGAETLPVVFFAGIDREYIVSEQSGPVEGLVRKAKDRFEHFLEIVRPPLRRVRENRARVEFETIGLKEFSERFPHPTPAKTPFCLGNGSGTADWFSGARFCMACRDRLSLVTALSSAPAVRVVPVQ